MKITEIEISKLKPYDKNAKEHPQSQIDNVAQSIKEFGFQQPIVVDKNYIIIIGHCRWLASLQLGLAKVPVVVADELSDEQVKKLRLIDNKTNESDWDLQLLLEEIKELDFSDYNIDWEVGELEEDDPEVVDDDFNVDEFIKTEPESKAGDIFELGDHRLMCGDSTNEQDVNKLVNGEVIDLLFTDPPYNVNVENSEGMKIANDNLSNDEFERILSCSFRNAANVLKSGGDFFVWHGDSQRVRFQVCLEDNSLLVKQCLIWVKNGFNFGRQDFKWMHEPCLYGWKDGAAHYFAPEFNHPTVLEDKIDLEQMKKEELKKLCEELLSDSYPSTIIHENKPLKNDLHPTMKPVTICAYLIRLASKKNDAVLDLFGGSGSTLIACEQLGRKCYMMEYDPVYCDVIISRWEKFTGKKAKKVNA